MTREQHEHAGRRRLHTLNPPPGTPRGKAVQHHAS
ncbi:hypothetical protein M2158_002609 [Streptomyces sp. SAI-144]|nr:hypothetical protein [Streptomyces sp. SAI-144]MDH6490497.1 hypothetical protein [Streptomyces sp. SAI-127]